MRRLRFGNKLGGGCGIGRNLHHLGADAVGIDHNADSIAVARSLGLTAYTREEFLESADCVPARFDTILLAHVVGHMDRAATVDIVADYLRFLKPEGRLGFTPPPGARYRAAGIQRRFPHLPRPLHP